MNVHSQTNLPAAPRTLIADDQRDVLTALDLLLKSEGHQIETATSAAAVLEAVRERDFDILLMDLNYARDTTSGLEGLDLISRIRDLNGTLPVVAMTAWGSIELAVEAMRRGVSDFVLKPWENARLLDTLRAQIEAGRRGRANSHARFARVTPHDLDEAQEVQRRLLPEESFRLGGCQVVSAWLPARGVGGDYCDILPLGSRNVGLCIGDVAGKGLPAALLMANVQAAVRACAPDHATPRALVERVNRIVCGNFTAHRFATFFYGVLDAGQGRFAYVNAGHNPPLLVSLDGTSRQLSEGGPILGVFPEGVYEPAEVELRSGDRLLLYTDGITEARNENGEEFGEERLLALLAANRALDAEGLRDLILEAVSKFSHGDLWDDATLMVLAVG